MTMLLRIAERVLNRPLLVHPDKVPLILALLDGRIPLGDTAVMRAQAEENILALPEDARRVLTGPAPDSSRFVGSPLDEDPDTGRIALLPYRRTRDGVAVVSVTGSLINRGAWIGSYSGETSYEGIQHQLATAAADPRAKAILLDIESPGGEAVGAFETAAAVRAAAAKKPLTAIVNGMAASAAYALASGARRVVTTPTGVSGSIGVVLLHADFSRALDKKGITPTLIFAGAHKVDGNPFEPLPEGVRDDLQREVDQYYDLFVDTVVAGRRGLSAKSVRDTQARVFIGAEAVAAGLADEVGTFETALAELSASSSPARNRATTGATMSKDVGQPGTESSGIGTAELNAAVDKARTEGHAAGRAEGMKAGAEAERARILGIEKIAPAGHETLVAALKADGTTTPEQAAMKILEAEKATRGMRMRAIEETATEAGKIAAAPSAAGAGGPAPKASTPDEWKAEFAASAKLQQEFAAEEYYVAFKKAEAAGKVRILGRRA